MIKKKIRYTDYDGNEIIDNFYFHLSKAELAEMELVEKDGLAAILKKIIEEDDRQRIIDYFKKIILMSYGQRSNDGKRFIKTQQLSDEFKQTDAFSELFIELCTDSNAASEFIRGVIPASLAVEEVEAKPILENLETVTKDPSQMSKEELLKAYNDRIQGSGM